MTTTPDFRELCAELVDSLENARRIIQGGDGTLHINTAEFVLRRARAALSTPPPEPPSLKEQALKALERQSIRSIPSLVSNNDCDTVRRALEALPND